MNAQRVILLFVSLAAVLLAGVLVWRVTASRDAAPPPAAVGGPFELVDVNGRPVDEAVLKGKWSAVFFGFTYCPDVCPMTLQALDAAAGRLGPKGKDLQIVFVSVDPQRDTPGQMKAYLEAQNLKTPAVGLTGTPEQVAAVAKAYRVYYAKAGEGEGYTVNHSTAAYLMDPRGRFERVLGFGLTPEQMADQIRDAMG